MKIAWFTPFNEKSAIGKYSKIATDALSRYAAIDIFYSDEEATLKTKLATFKYLPGVDLWSNLAEYDLVVYNMGDFAKYHKNIYDVLQAKRGIIIIHDATLLGFFYEYYCNYKNRTVGFKKLYEQLYNDSAFNASARYLSEDGIKYGFMEQITKFCSGIIVHSDFHANIIRNVFNGPLNRIYFPFSREYLSSQNEDIKHDKNTSIINMLTVGNINRNKRVFEVVQAIARSSLLKKKLNYTIIGSQGDKEYINKIKSIINKYNITDNIKLLGYVNDNILADYYKNADIICNLRNPALEGASWSLVEQMSLGKPVIVSDNGFYSEIPDDCVFKISIENEEEDLTNLLTLIVENQDALMQKGKNAKNLVDTKFSQAQYAQAFMSFAEQIIYGKPMEILMNKLTNVMNQVTITKDMKIVDTLSEQMELLFTRSRN